MKIYIENKTGKKKRKRKNSPDCARGLNSVSLGPCKPCASQLQALTDDPHPSYAFSPHPHTRTSCHRRVGPARQLFSTPHASILASPTHAFPWIADMGPHYPDSRLHTPRHYSRARICSMTCGPISSDPSSCP